MNYWMTTQWPSLEDQPDSTDAELYLADGFENAGKDLSPGDHVLIYETLGGPTEFVTLAGGATKKVRRKTGKMGIVTVAEVAGHFIRDTTAVPTDYVGHKPMNWCWTARTRRSISNGFVKAEDVCKVLGYKPTFNFHGFGDLNSGLKKISQEQYDQLVAIFKQHPLTQPISTTGEAPKQGRSFEGGGGESEEHRSLKNYVAAHPSEVLGERGVVHEQTEYSFVTGDRADIVLRDHAGRVIGVEIEIRQDANDHDGILQAIKYRFMLAFMFSLAYEASRSLLVAYELADSVKLACEQYDIAWRVVDRCKVQDWLADQQPTVNPPFEC